MARRPLVVAGIATAVVVVALLVFLAIPVDLRGRVVDDYTGEGIVASLTYEGRGAKSGADGSFVFTGLPRLGQIRVDSTGYRRIFVPTTQAEIRMMPLALTVQVREDGTKDKLIGRAQIRFEGRIIGQANDSGNTVISPHPGPGTSITVCANGYEPKTVPARGVLLIVDLKPGPTGCPPLSR